MNAIELLIGNAAKVIEPATAVYKSKRLGKLLGLDSPFEIKIKEIPAKSVTQYMAMQYDKGGNFSYEKNLFTKKLVAVEGIIEPSLANEELRKAYNAPTPADLAEILFQNELTEISDAILKLSGIEDDDVKEENSSFQEIKN